MPKTLGRSGVCLKCHAPSNDQEAPAASAASLVLGVGGVRVVDGAPLIGPSPHREVEGLCLGCHTGKPTAAMERGANHSFAVDQAKCAPCHGSTPEPGARKGRQRPVAEWARELLRRAIARGLVPKRLNDGGPVHATRLAQPRDVPQRRALRDVLLVLEDPAAETHNAPYARALLIEAEAAIPAR
jgi:hypothetical protein